MEVGPEGGVILQCWCYLLQQAGGKKAEYPAPPYVIRQLWQRYYSESGCGSVSWRCLGAVSGFSGINSILNDGVGTAVGADAQFRLGS